MAHKQVHVVQQRLMHLPCCKYLPKAEAADQAPRFLGIQKLSKAEYRGMQTAFKKIGRAISYLQQNWTTYRLAIHVPQTQVLQAQHVC